MNNFSIPGSVNRKNWTRRQIMGLTVALPFLAEGAASAETMSSLFSTYWSSFQKRFLSADGRVIDTGNHGISHSEGQGYGMLFAVHAGDQHIFDKMWEWTQTNLAQPNCTLHSWKYVPNAAINVPEPNAATDAELMIALALTRASLRWNEPALLQQASQLFTDIRLLLTTQIHGLNLLLPGQVGFTYPDHVIINPSYYLFPALQAAAEVDASPQWRRISANGLDVLARAHFGKWQLPPDWVRVSKSDGTLTPAPGWPPRFSYDAIRVPLYLAWGKQLSQADMNIFSTYWNEFAPHIPAWVNLQDNTRSPYDAPTGFRDVARLSGWTQWNGLSPDLEGFSDTDDYYSSALCLLCLMIADELRVTKTETGTSKVL